LRRSGVAVFVVAETQYGGFVRRQQFVRYSAQVNLEVVRRLRKTRF